MEALKVDFANASIVPGYDEESIELDVDMIPKTGVSRIVSIDCSLKVMNRSLTPRGPREPEFGLVGP